MFMVLSHSIETMVVCSRHILCKDNDSKFQVFIGNFVSACIVIFGCGV